VAKPIIGLLCVAVLAFGVQWYGARGEVEQLQARIQVLETRAAEAPAPRSAPARAPAREARSTTVSTPAPANGVRVEDLPEEQQAALMLAALSQSGQGGDGLAELQRDNEMLRRRLERAESATARAEKARRESSNKCAGMLRERQALIEQNAQLREALAQLTAAIAAASEGKPPEPFIRR